MNVLIVDDAEDCAATLEMALAGRGLQVTHVTSAEDALAHIPEVSAIVTDVQLPGMSGIELIARAGGAPVVVVSAAADPGVREEALSAGAAAFFPKPFSPGAVCDAVRELLKERSNA